MASIFLSHSFADKVFVRRLAQALQSNGIKVWLDEAEMKVGDSLIGRIQTAIDEADYVGVVLSPHSARSEWVQRELRQALTNEFASRRIKVLPILRADCDIPGFLRDKLYADLRNDADFDRGVDALLRRLRSTSAASLDAPNSASVAVLSVGYGGEIVGSDDEVRRTVREALDNIQSGVSPPFVLNLSRDVLANTSQLIDTALSLGPRGSRELSSRLAHLDATRQLSSSEREERLKIRSLLRAVQPQADTFVRSILWLLSEPVISDSGYASISEGPLRNVREIAKRVFGGTVAWAGSKIDLFRHRPPELQTSIFLNEEEFECLEKALGYPATQALRIRGGLPMGELGLDVIRDKALPAILVEVNTISGKLQPYLPEPAFANTSEWFIGLG